jgi:hypothetical protein
MEFWSDGGYSGLERLAIDENLDMQLTVQICLRKLHHWEVLVSASDQDGLAKAEA